ncbi:hypothetical protein BOTBODRAFT_300005 [Botryobasidium botryosum FD-172 SS1]|uniref:Uncharacterized protein n=1 Tax=Botryobasidium botryosum (strain FD-172 SS1) TaxID=930990 RepID=A0A067MGR2_BOTB1|nr:hypothetical protein BOTBODRAFT_300005 [Botryobasidium botryosum FD-172 SS1]
MKAKRRTPGLFVGVGSGRCAPLPRHPARRKNVAYRTSGAIRARSRAMPISSRCAVIRENGNGEVAVRHLTRLHHGEPEKDEAAGVGYALKVQAATEKIPTIPYRRGETSEAAK